MNNNTAPTILITGAAGTLGRAVAHAFAQQGARLVLLDLGGEALDRAYPPDANTLSLPVDLLDREAMAQAVKQALQRFSSIEVLVNCAGGFRMGEPVHALSDETWDAMQAMNVRTTLNAMRAVVPHMLTQGRGKVVNVGAMAAALGGQPHMSAYCASKSAVIQLTESMAAELRDKGINVNCVLPTIIDTPANRADMPGADFSRWVSPADLAAVIVFLSSDAARAVHGAAIPVIGLS
jgi:NAD(P)-dependent dehydrogenase (short-subunit alcohol dehydrogenase family)